MIAWAALTSSGLSLGWITSALSIVAAVASGVATVLFVDRQGLRTSISDLRGRVGDLESERDDFKVKLAEERADHAKTRAERDTVSRLVTGQESLDQIKHELVEQKDAMAEHHRAAMRGLTQIATSVERLGDRFDAFMQIMRGK